MAETRKIKRALVSVFHKDGLEEILRTLNALGVELLSTGGTQSFIESLGFPCRKVEDVTSYPSILGGRVKTLHPKIFGGILGRREPAALLRRRAGDGLLFRKGGRRFLLSAHQGGGDHGIRPPDGI